MLPARVEAFLAVARTGNVSRAAEELFLTQPALTARLKALEEEVGAALFIRTSRGMRLSEAGRAFLPYAEHSVGLLLEGKAQLADLARGGGGSLSIGATPGVGTYTLPAVLERFHTRHPTVSVSVRTGHTEDIVELVAREQVQVGLGRAMPHPNLEMTELYEDELVLVVPRQHWLSASDVASVEDIKDDRIILFDRASSYYELTQALFRSAGIMALKTMELDNIEAAKRMVERGLGVALLPRAAVVRDVAEGRLWLVPFQDGPPVRRPIVAFRRRDVPTSATVTAFLEIAREIVGRLG